MCQRGRAALASSYDGHHLQSGHLSTRPDSHAKFYRYHVFIFLMYATTGLVCALAGEVKRESDRVFWRLGSPVGEWWGGVGGGTTSWISSMHSLAVAACAHALLRRRLTGRGGRHCHSGGGCREKMRSRQWPPLCHDPRRRSHLCSSTLLMFGF